MDFEFKQSFMVNDPISDLIIQIKNAGMAKLPSIVVSYSNEKNAIATLLQKEGYVGDVTVRGKKTKKGLEIAIKYNMDGTAKIKGVKRISKPSRRLYTKVKDITREKSSYGIMVLSTPEGICTDKQALDKRAGGEMLFEIW